MKTKTLKPKKVPFPIHPISEWSVTKYGVTLLVNPTSFPFFDNGCSLDVEDDEQGNFVGLGIYNPSDNTCYYWNTWPEVTGVTLSPFIAHNGRTDLAKLQKWGFKIDSSYLLWDTQLMEHILDSSKKRYGLKALAEELGIKYPSYEDITGKKGSKHHVTLKEVDPILVSEYNACDCYAAYKRYERQKALVEENVFIDGKPVDSRENRYFEKIEKPSCFIFQKMEERGVRVDIPYLKGLKEQLEAQKQPIVEAILNELGPINLNSPKQLLEALNAKGIFPVFKGKPSTDKRALENMPEGVVSNLRRYSEVDTLLTSFVDPYLERGEEITHPNYNQCGTRTGRPSCSNPNLLQIPRRTENGKLVRKMFIAREGCLLGDCDFGQIEPRVLAHLSKDNTLRKMFCEGVDFHTFTSERLKISRDAAKILNLSVGYRATYKSVSQQLKCSWAEAQKEINAWWSMFPGLYDWQQQLIYQCRKDGYFTTLMGRRIKVEDLNHGNQFRREGAERQLINNITQGSAAEIMKLAMVAVDKAGVDILVQVYDELLIEECEEGIQEAVLNTIAAMQNCITLDVPLTVDAGIGRNWTEAKA